MPPVLYIYYVWLLFWHIIYPFFQSWTYFKQCLMMSYRVLHFTHVDHVWFYLRNDDEIMYRWSLLVIPTRLSLILYCWMQRWTACYLLDFLERCDTIIIWWYYNLEHYSSIIQFLLLTTDFCSSTFKSIDEDVSSLFWCHNHDYGCDIFILNFLS